MKELRLNQQKKDKLSEIVLKILPQYSVGISMDGVLKFGNGFDLKPVFEIHWFEFCITKIPLHLKDKSGNLVFNGGSGTLILQKWEEESIHPIDYIYSEFKKHC